MKAKKVFALTPPNAANYDILTPKTKKGVLSMTYLISFLEGIVTFLSPCLQRQGLGLSCLLDTHFPLHLVVREASQS